MKKVLILLFLVVFCVQVGAQTLQGGVVYTVESAREEAFRGVRYTIPVRSFRKYLVDSRHGENVEAMANGKMDLSDRWLERYSDGWYSIMYKKDVKRGYFYNDNGQLTNISMRLTLDYPIKSYRYDRLGNLFGISFYVSASDIYIYTVTGVLEYHWVGDNCYDIDGKIVSKRIK